MFPESRNPLDGKIQVGSVEEVVLEATSRRVTPSAQLSLPQHSLAQPNCSSSSKASPRPPPKQQL